MNREKDKSAAHLADKYLTISAYLVLAMTAFIAYHQILYNDFVDFDDNIYVTKNPHVLSGLSWQNIRWAFAEPYAGFWHPLTMLSYMLDCSLFGLNPSGHHLSSLLLHIANTLALFLILKAMTGAVWRSAFVAAAFALHPLHVESVAWTAERKDVLSGLFWMLTLGCYLWYVRRHGTVRYLVTLFVFILGLMAKPMLITLPFVMLLLDYWPLNRINLKLRGIGKLVWEKLPFFAFSVIAGIIAFFAQEGLGALTKIKELPLRIRLANAFISYLLYLWKMIWPGRLAVYYPHRGISLPMWQAVIAAVLLLIIFFCVIRLAKRFGYLLTGWLWYVGTLFPVIGLVQVGSHSMADRYTYVPLIGIFIMIAWGLYDLCAAWRYRKIVLGLSAPAVLLILGVCTFFQTRYWRDSFTLFEHAAKAAEGNYIMYNNLGSLLASQDKPAEAIRQYNLALQINPFYAPPYYNIGIALESQGKSGEAVNYYRQAIELDPNYSDAYYNLGKVLHSQGKTDEAISCYTRASQINPDFAAAHYNLANVLVSQGKPDEAAVHYRKAIQADPHNVEAYNNLASVLQLQGKLDEAINLYQQTLNVDPNYAPAHHNFAGLLMKTGRFDEALEQYLHASRLKPDWPLPLNGIARIYITHPDANKRDAGQAVVFAQHAAELTKYEDPVILDTLASAYTSAGQFEKAVKTAEKTLELTAGKDEKLSGQIRKQMENYKAKSKTDDKK